MTETSASETACKRLLQAAVEIFAERGFRDATVREICTKAGVNVASVNYYFRSKQALYVKALSFAFETANRLYLQDAALDTALPPEARLRFLIRNFLFKLLDDSHLGLHGKLIVREIANPTAALDEVISTAIYPQFMLLESIVGDLLRPNQDKAVVHRCVLSIFGQCLMFKHSRSVIDRLYPEAIATPQEIERTAEHIAQFSLLALRQLATAEAE